MLDKKYYYQIDNKQIATIEVLQTSNVKLHSVLITPGAYADYYPGILIKIANVISIAMQQQKFSSMHLAWHIASENKHEYIRLIPVKDQNNNLDILAKTNRLIYLFFNHEKFLPIQDIPKNFIRILSSDFNKYLDILNPNPIPYPEHSSVTNYRVLYDKIANFLELPKTLLKNIPKTFNRHIKQCAFCNQRVLETQSVYESENFTVLINYAPYGTVPDNAHFMILPKSHYEDWRSLNDGEIHEFYHLSQSIINSISESLKINKHSIIGLLQNGLCAGQTVPHCHFHIFYIEENPEKFLLHIKEQYYNKHPFRLSNQEIQRVINKYQPIINKFYTNR